MRASQIAKGAKQEKVLLLNQSKVACEIEAQDALNIENTHTVREIQLETVSRAGKPKLTL